MPSLSDAYLVIATRHEAAAQLALDADLPELAVFHAYHAFESAACAAIAFKGAVVPRRHRAKLDRFIALHRRFTFVHGAAALAVVMVPLRNRSLYPGPEPENETPEGYFIKADAQTLLRRVRGQLAAIKNHLAAP